MEDPRLRTDQPPSKDKRNAPQNARVQVYLQLPKVQVHLIDGTKNEL